MISVLYVDDEPDLLEIGKLFLEQSEDLHVDTMTSARAALVTLGKVPYDAIISDYQMPEMDGLSFLKEVRAQYTDIPFILFTGRGREEVVIEAMLAGLALYLFIAHIFTHSHPFIEPGLFTDRNFSVGLLFIFVVGIILLATMALLPPFMQNLMGYPVLDVGYLLAPRGVGTMIAMVTVGKLSGKVDPRYKIFVGLVLTSYSLWEMTRFTTDVTGWDIVRTGIVQGLGLGFIFVPLSTITFSTLAPHYRNEGTALFSLMRNIGSSIGISVVITYLAQRTQANHAALADYINPFSFALRQATEAGAYNVTSPEGLAVINGEITRQAATLAYLQDFRLMMFITLAAIPLIVLLRAPRKKTAAAEEIAVME